MTLFGVFDISFYSVLSSVWCWNCWDKKILFLSLYPFSFSTDPKKQVIVVIHKLFAEKKIHLNNTIQYKTNPFDFFFLICNEEKKATCLNRNSGKMNFLASSHNETPVLFINRVLAMEDWRMIKFMNKKRQVLGVIIVLKSKQTIFSLVSVFFLCVSLQFSFLFND